MDIVLIVGRVIFGGFFLVMGMNHFMKVNDMTEYAKMKKVPFAKLSVLLSGLLIMIGGLSVVFDYDAHYGYLLIIAFLLPVSFMMHQFWGLKDDKEKMMVEMSMFMKNIALLGAALMGMALAWPV